MAETFGGNRDLHLQLVKESRGQIYAIVSMTRMMELVSEVKTLRQRIEQKQ